MQRQRHFKAGVSGIARSKLSIGSYSLDGLTEIELRIHDTASNREVCATLTRRQARKAAQLLAMAVKAAEAEGRPDDGS